jgi:alkylation response protein AidB-like acyl-CoA dehydrogenase
VLQLGFRPDAGAAPIAGAGQPFAQKEQSAVAYALEETNTPLPSQIGQAAAEMGFLGINLNPAYGSAGLGHPEAVLVLEAVAKVSPAVAFPIF